MLDEAQPIIHLGINGAEGHIGTILREGLAGAYQIKAFTLTDHAFPSTVADLAHTEQVEGLFQGLDAVIQLAADPSPFSADASRCPR